MVVDRSLASFFFYAGNPNQCLYIESEVKAVVDAAESKFENLQSTVGTNAAVQFPAGEEPPALYDDKWVEAWLTRHNVV